MAEAADQADKVRRFLERVSVTVPEGERSDEFVSWFHWAVRHANKLDPLSRPERVAKRMKPDRSEG